MSLKPIKRSEMILDGQDIEPVTRLEYFLKKAAEGGGGGGGSEFMVATTKDIGNSPEGNTPTYTTGALRVPKAMIFQRGETVEVGVLFTDDLNKIVPLIKTDKEFEVLTSGPTLKLPYEAIRDLGENYTYGLTVSKDGVLKPVNTTLSTNDIVVVSSDTELEWRKFVQK